MSTSVIMKRSLLFLNELLNACNPFVKDMIICHNDIGSGLSIHLQQQLNNVHLVNSVIIIRVSINALFSVWRVRGLW